MVVPHPHSILPDGGVQTSMIADRSVARRLATHTVARRARWLIPAIVVAGSILSLSTVALGNSPGFDTLLDWALAMVLGVIVGGVITLPMLVLMWWMTLRQVRTLIPDGTLLTSEFGADWIGYGADGIHTRLRLSELDRIRVSRTHLVAFVAGQPVLIIPRELVPNEVAEGIVQRHREIRAVHRPGDAGAQGSGAEHAGVDGPGSARIVNDADGTTVATMVADRGLPMRLVRATFTGSSLVLCVVAVAILVAWAIIDDAEGAGILVSAPVIGAVVFVGVLATSYWQLFARLRRLMPVGAQLYVRYSPDRVEATYGTVATSVSLADVTRIRETRAAIDLCHGRTPVLTIPADMVPPGFVDHVRTNRNT